MNPQHSRRCTPDAAQCASASRGAFVLHWGAKVKAVRRLPLALIVMLFGLLPFGARTQTCTPSAQIRTVKPGTLTVTSMTVPPFIYEVGKGQFAGMDADIIHQFAQDHCLTVDHMVVEPAAVIQYVVTGRADVAAGGWYRSSERAKVLGISAPIYLSQMAIHSRDGATQLEQLKGRSVGTVQGYLWVAELRKLYGEQLKLYPNPVALMQDMSSGRIDAAINTYAVGVAAQGGLEKSIHLNVAEPDARVRISVFPAQTGFVYNKQNDALGQALNQTIAALRQSGELGRIMEKYGLPASAADVGEARYADQ